MIYLKMVAASVAKMIIMLRIVHNGKLIGGNKRYKKKGCAMVVAWGSENENPMMKQMKQHSWL